MWVFQKFSFMKYMHHLTCDFSHHERTIAGQHPERERGVQLKTVTLVDKGFFNFILRNG
jgi:hypothetical protein